MADIIELIRQGKIKRFFRARRKLSYAGLISHITQRATGREPLFVEDSDYLYMLKIIKETAEKYGLQVLAFCLMPNHCHILERQNEDNLSVVMQSLFTRYARYFNKKYYRKGHLFCGPFRQASCFDDYYLLSASVYIHLNPEKAGIVAKSGQYRWSTWNLYCGERAPDTFVDWKFILRFLDDEYSAAKRKYRRLISRARDYRVDEALEERKAIGKFSIWMRKTFPELITDKKKGQQDFLPDGYISDTDLDREINRLKEHKRLTHPGDRAARKFAIEQLQSRGFSIQEIMEYMEISRTTIYKARNQ